ncbi:MAG: M14 family zinc carboxypeptidase [Sarcina sp.]
MKRKNLILVFFIIVIIIVLYICFFKTTITKQKNITNSQTQNNNAKATTTEISSIKTSQKEDSYEKEYPKLTVTNNTNIYANPDLNSTVLETIDAGDKVVKVENMGKFTKILYYTSVASKDGYIESEFLKPSAIIPNNFNDFSVPSNVKKIEYGKSGENRPLYYYQIGNGKKTLLMTFEIHGFEDAWAQDGLELTKIAKYLIMNLAKEDSDNKGLNDWTIDIVPSANPDGLLDGHTNAGPGRSQITKQIDINRDFPGPGFVPTATARNNTDGATPLQAPEAKALANLTDKLMKESDGKLAVVDTHGWLDMTSGNQNLANYFDEQFNLHNTVIHKMYYGGYFVGYAKMIGAKSVIVELPKPTSPENLEAQHFDQKMLNAVNNLIKDYNLN